MHLCYFRVLVKAKHLSHFPFAPVAMLMSKKADLTDQMNAKSEELDEKGMRWMELAKAIEEAEAEN